MFKKILIKPNKGNNQFNKKIKWIQFECDGCKKTKERKFSEIPLSSRKNYKKMKLFCNRKCLKKYHNNRICSVDGCNNKLRSNNLCIKHNYQYKTHGKAEGNRCVYCNNFIDKKGGKYLEIRNKIAPNSCWSCYYKNLKSVVLMKIGEECKCCGESIKEFLQVDHKFGGGYKAYKTIYQSGVHEDAFFNSQKYQTLCANCNLGRHLNGGLCPHIQKEQIKFSKKLTKKRFEKINFWVKKNFHPNLHLHKIKN